MPLVVSSMLHSEIPKAEEIDILYCSARFHLVGGS